VATVSSALPCLDRPGGLERAVAAVRCGDVEPRSRRFEDTEFAAYLLRVVRGRTASVRGEERDALAAGVRFGLSALSLGYTGATAALQAAYRCGLRTRERLPVPVISVGNIALGGSGKTPLTRWIAQTLMASGLRVGLLLRGHGGTLVREGGIVSVGSGVLLDASEAGDEAVMHAISLPGVSVAVGRDRVRTGRLLIERAGCEVLVLDDGFQYWRLHRDLDLALVPADDPFGNGWALPRGLLREPPSRLRRADALFVTHTERVSAEDVHSTIQRLQRIARSGADLFTCRLTAACFANLETGAAMPLQALRGQRVFLLSAIAANEQFARTAADLGLTVAGHRQLPDHFAYDRRSLELASDEARRLSVSAIVTTEKDAVKLAPDCLRLPAYVLCMELEIDDRSAFEACLLSRSSRSLSSGSSRRSDRSDRSDPSV
jgi:tetraacyldisaccharide 4'-kinase